MNALRKIRSELMKGPTRENMLLKLFIGIALVGLITIMFPHGEAIDFSYSVGAVWADNDLIAPFSYPILKDARPYDKELQAAAAQVYPVFKREDTSTTLQQQRLT